MAEPLRRETLAVQAYEQLRRRILFHELPPGTRLNERELAQELGVSITPIREALNRLERDGLVLRQPWVGTMVADFTEREISTLYDLRVTLETMALRQAFPHVRPEELDQLEQLQMRMRELAETGGSVEEIDALNHQFHSYFLEKAANRWLTNVLNNLQDVLFMLRYPITDVRRGTRSPEEHTEIIKALRAGLPDKATSLMTAHIVRVKNEVLAHYRYRPQSQGHSITAAPLQT